MRVSELARELKVTSKELLSQLKTLNIPAKTHASSVKEESIAKVRTALKAKGVKKGASPSGMLRATAAYKVPEKAKGAKTRTTRPGA